MADSTVRCGTISGYQTHRKHQQTPCDDCRKAWNEYGRANRKRWKRPKRIPLAHQLQEQRDIAATLAAALAKFICHKDCIHNNCASARAALTIWETNQ